MIVYLSYLLKNKKQKLINLKIILNWIIYFKNIKIK